MRVRWSLLVLVLVLFRQLRFKDSCEQAYCRGANMSYIYHREAERKESARQKFFLQSKAA